MTLTASYRTTSCADDRVPVQTPVLVQTHRLWLGMRTAVCAGNEAGMRRSRFQARSDSLTGSDPSAPTSSLRYSRPMAGPSLEALLREPARTALLVIDMQNDFLLPDAPVATPGGLDLVPRIAALASAARGAGFPVVYTQEMHRADHSDFGIELAFEPPHCLEGTPGMDLVAG